MENAFENALTKLRQEYLQSSLSENDVAKDPFVQFQKWFQEALNAKLNHLDAMTLATVTAEGTPDARTVLLKGVEKEGLRFYTNYHSAKGRQLDLNSAAALVFFWGDLERQVRIKGTVQKTSDDDSDQYFHSRPIGAQLASSVSPQSEVVPNRDWLDLELGKAEEKNKTTPLVRPPHWGGYLFTPREFEFWQGRENRMSDRVRYRLKADHAWLISRLAP
jgi:pyridoxamine 5'-phosphate oxidase